MSELSEAFAELLAEHRRIGSPAPDYLIPGPPVDEARRHLEDLGLEPSDEVVEYFALQSGLDYVAWAKVRPEGSYADIYLYPPFEPTPLHAVERLNRVCLEIVREVDVPEVARWEPSWVPLLGSNHHTYAADCRGGAMSAVWFQSFWEAHIPTTPLYPSVAALLRDFAERLRNGVATWSERGWDWDWDETMRLDRELAARCSRRRNDQGAMRLRHELDF